MEENFEKKSTKKVGIIIAVIVALLVVAAIVGGLLYLNLNKKPEKIFTKSIEDAFEMPEKKEQRKGKVELELSAEMNADDPQIKAVNEMLKAIKIKSTTEIDLDKKILNENILATYDNEQVISLDALIQNETAYLYLKDLYSKYIEINEEYLEGMDLSTIFEASTEAASEDLLKDLKQILIDEVEARELTQEKTELNDKKVLKSTLRLTSKEALEVVVKLLEKTYEYQRTEELKTAIDDLKDEIEYLDETENYADISIYTKGLKNEFVKLEVVLTNVEDDETIVFEAEKKLENEVVISMGMNENSTEVSGVKELIVITVNKENENKGTVRMEIKVEDQGSITLNIKYNVDYNAEIKEKNTSNSITINEFSEVDANEIMTNIQKNEILYGLIEMFVGSSIPQIGE